MKCPDEATLEEYISGELDPAKAATVAEHIRGCPSCAQETEAITRASAVFANMASIWCEDPEALLPAPTGESHFTDDEVVELVSGFAPKALASRLRQHMSRCGRCFREVSLTAKLSDALEAGDAATVRSVHDEMLALTPTVEEARVHPTPAPSLPEGTREVACLAWQLSIPLLRPTEALAPALAADQLVETRATPDGALQVSVEVRLPDEGLAVDEDVPITIHILAAPDRPELVDIAFSCELQEGPDVVWEGVIQLVRRRGHIQASVPRPRKEGYQIKVEPVGSE